jgi:hypothetical protein
VIIAYTIVLIRKVPRRARSCMAPVLFLDGPFQCLRVLIEDDTVLVVYCGLESLFFKSRRIIRMTIADQVRALPYRA